MLRLFANRSASKPSSLAERPGLTLRPAPEVKASEHPDGVVLIHLGKGAVFSANRVGAMIWHGIEERRSLATVTESISSQFSIPAQTVEQDAAAFLAQLQAEGLLIAEGPLK